MKFMTFVRRTIGVSLWLLADAVAILAGVWVLFSNYSGLRTAFELSGLDMMPLAQDSLLGSVFEAFGLGEATQADLYAGAVATAVGLGTFLLFHFLLRGIRLWYDRQDYLREGDSVRARMALGALKMNLIYTAFLAPILGLALYWDFQLFQFRILAGIIGLDRPEQTWNLEDWDNLLKSQGGTFALWLAQIGPWGYLAVTGCISFIIEWLIRQTQEASVGWGQALVSLFTFRPAQQADASSPRQAPQGRPEEAAAEQDPQAELIATASGSEENAVDRQDEVLSTPLTVALTPADLRTPVNVPALDPAPPLRRVVHTPKAEDMEFDVIGGHSGEQVRLSIALAQPSRYVVDSDRRRVWDRDHYARLHGDSDSTATEAA